MAIKTENIKKEIKEKDVLIFLIPNIKYSEKLKEIVHASAKTFDKICYISLNKPYDTLALIFQKSGIKTQSMIFIDAVTGGFKKTGDLKVIFVSSPKALTELNIEINNVIDKGKIQEIIFDSLSTILAYEQPATVIKFSHSVISKLRAAKVKGIFTVLKNDMNSELIKDISMFVDGIVELN